MLRKMRTTLIGLVGVVVLTCLLLAGCASVTPTASVSVPSTAAPSLEAGKPPEANATPTSGLSVPRDTPIPAKAGEPLSALEVKLELTKLPRLGETMFLTVTVRSRFPDIDVPGVRAWIELPESVVPVGGILEWQGDLKAGASAQFQAALQFRMEGEWRLTARASPGPGTKYLSAWAADVLTLVVGRDSTRFATPAGARTPAAAAPAQPMTRHLP